MPTPPVDFDKIRVAFAETLQETLGLPSNNVIQLQMESPPAPRPHLPQVSFSLTSLGVSYGRDSLHFAATDTWTYYGPRMLTGSFQFYGVTHEVAYAFATTWHAALDQDPTQQMLMQKGGLSVWRRDPPMDISAMLFAGYEGRASMNCTFGVQAQSTITMAEIGEVPVSGQVGSDGEISVTINDGEG